MRGKSQKVTRGSHRNDCVDINTGLELPFSLLYDFLFIMSNV